MYLIIEKELENISGGNLYNKQLVSVLSEWGIGVCVYKLNSEIKFEQWLSSLLPHSVIILDSIVGEPFVRVLKKRHYNFKIVYLCHLPMGLRLNAGKSQKVVLLNAEKQILKWSEFTICTSEFTEKYLQRLHESFISVVLKPQVGVPRAQLRVRRKKTTCNDDALNILCVGNIHVGKGQLKVIQGLLDFTDVPWNITFIAGQYFSDTDYLSEIQSIVDQLGLQSRVRLRFDLSGELLWEEYQQASVFVSLTEFETYGMALAEACSFGLPIVVNDVGGVRESTNKDSTVYLSNDKQSFTRCLRRIFYEPMFFENLKIAALKNADALNVRLDEHQASCAELRSRLSCLN
ncbi:glycosyltransferase family 4 protein [Agaribacter marinus]|uniref:Glycosyl transferase family 1 domain-containing protein n=1 Tax=Agaribacter marinus TaxID=1431249 RepID=A0AA37WKV5_9ALTE|nr:glycosyltransferase family 4 protein [Agaribacter marinus]GLR71315.1 hypothetical protein GCM10007852_22230 [Agaribacter marinus]